MKGNKLIAGNPPVLFTDYTLLYYKKNKTTKGQLGFLAFCKKLNEGKKVNIGNITFLKHEVIK